MKNKSYLFLIIINLLCAIIWWCNVYIDITFGIYSTGVILLHVICAIIWSASAMLHYAGYINKKRRNQYEEY